MTRKDWQELAVIAFIILLGCIPAAAEIALTFGWWTPSWVK